MDTDVLDLELPTPAPVSEQRALIAERVAAQTEIARLEARAIELDAKLVEAVGAGACEVWQRRDLPMEALSEFGREAADRVHRLAMELGAALRVATPQMVRELDHAHTLHTACATVMRHLSSGVITAKHAEVIAAETQRFARFAIDRGMTAPHEVADVVARLQDQAASFAERMTPGRLRHALRRAADEAAPKSVVEAHRLARQERRIWFESAEDGMTLLHALIPTFCAAGIKDRLSRMAWAVKKESTRQRQDEQTGASTAWTDGGSEASAVSGAFTRSASGVDDAAGEAGNRAQSTADEHSTTSVAGTDMNHAGDRRTIPQITADMFTELLLASVAMNPEMSGLDAIRAHINVVVPVETLVANANVNAEAASSANAASDASSVANAASVAGVSAGAGAVSQPGLLAGTGPSADPPPGRVTGPVEGAIDPIDARHLAGAAKHWTRLFRDPDTRALRTADRYRPEKDQRRLLVSRDETCRFMGCLQHAAHCDLDHATPYSEGGQTRVSNLAALCPSHHRGKHRYGWRVRHLDGGVLEWTSPLGFTYIDEPVSMVAFTGDG